MFPPLSLWIFFPTFTNALIFLLPPIKTETPFSASCSTSVMGFHHRKLLHPHLDSSNATMACGTICSPIPSPFHSQVSMPQQTFPWLSPLHNEDHIDRSYLLQIVMIVLACTVGVVLSLFIISKIMRSYYSRRYFLSRRSSPILFDIHGDSSPFSDDGGPATDHPIWFIPTVGLHQSIIDSITVCKYRKDEGLIDGTECSVCLSEFQEDESLRLLPKCGHAFHIPCIDTWLRSHKNCPLCRALIVHGTGGGTELVNATVPDSNSSGQDEDIQTENLDHVGESESSGLRVGDDDSGVLSSDDGGDNEVPDTILPCSGKMNCHSPIITGSAVSGQESEEEMHPMRSDSVDSSSASMIFYDAIDLNSDMESSDEHLDDKKVSSCKDIAIAKQGSGSSAIYKLASIGRALQKRRFSLKRSFSRNRKITFARSHSSTLPL